jgi:hypothetical protein
LLGIVNVAEGVDRRLLRMSSKRDAQHRPLRTGVGAQGVPAAADDRRICEAAFRCDRPYFKAFLSLVFDAPDKLVERNCRLIAAP